MERETMGQQSEEGTCQVPSCENPSPCFAHVACRPLRDDERWTTSWFLNMQGVWARYYTDDSHKSEVMRAASIGLGRYPLQTDDDAVAFGHSGSTNVRSEASEANRTSPHFGSTVEVSE